MSDWFVWQSRCQVARNVQGGMCIEQSRHTLAKDSFASYQKISNSSQSSVINRKLVQQFLLSNRLKKSSQQKDKVIQQVWMRADNITLFIYYISPLIITKRFHQRRLKYILLDVSLTLTRMTDWNILLNKLTCTTSPLEFIMFEFIFYCINREFWDELYIYLGYVYIHSRCTRCIPCTAHTHFTRTI